MTVNEPNKEILFVCGSYWPVVGGGERHAEDLSAALSRKGWPIRVVTRRNDPSWKVNEEKNGVPITRLGPSGSARWNKYLLGMHLARYIHERKGDIGLIYVAGFRTMGFSVVRAAHKYGIPVVLRAEACGEMSGEYIWKSPHADKKRPFLRMVATPFIKLRNRTLRKADCFLAIAEVIDNEFAAENVSSDRRCIIPNGIDFQKFSPVDENLKRSLRKSLKLPQNGYLFSYAGKLNRGKGLEVLLRAFAQVAKKHDDVYLVLIGSGGGMFLGCEDELRKNTKESNLGDRISFTGYVENVEDYLRASDAFVFPSEMEAFGLAPIEAAACGLPLISTKAGALAETMREGETAKTFPVGGEDELSNAMESTMLKKRESAQLAQNAYREFRKTYSMDTVAEKHASLFQSLISRNAG